MSLKTRSSRSPVIAKTKSRHYNTAMLKNGLTRIILSFKILRNFATSQLRNCRNPYTQYKSGFYKVEDGHHKASFILVLLVCPSQVCHTANLYKAHFDRRHCPKTVFLQRNSPTGLRTVKNPTTISGSLGRADIVRHPSSECQSYVRLKNWATPNSCKMFYIGFS